jgi:RimJ/RimL family protein N-acetyltransferase
VSKRHAPVILRSVANGDRDCLRGWYRTDREGLEQFFGNDLPSEDDYIAQFNRLFEQMQAYTARMLMAELKGEPIGFVMVTDVPPTLEVGRVHIYISPKKRRYAVRVAEAGMEEVKKMGIQLVFQNVMATNERAIRLGKKIGFIPSPILTMIKDLHQ